MMQVRFMFFLVLNVTSKLVHFGVYNSLVRGPLIKIILLVTRPNITLKNEIKRCEMGEFAANWETLICIDCHKFIIQGQSSTFVVP